MNELQKHKKLNFILKELFWQIHTGNINPISPGDVGLITNILNNNIFWKSNDQTYEFDQDINEKDLDWLQAQINLLTSNQNKKIDEYFDFMDENATKMGW